MMEDSNVMEDTSLHAPGVERPDASASARAPAPDNNPARDGMAAGLINGTADPGQTATQIAAGLVRALRRDLTARPRDEKGEPRPHPFVSEPVLLEPKPLAETKLAPAVAVIRARRPDLAHHLEDVHDRLLVHAIEDIGRVQEAEEQRLPERTLQAQAQNRAVEEAQAGVREEQAAALGPLQELLDRLEGALTRAQDAAINAFTKVAGGRYDPCFPSEEGLPHPAVLPEEAVAAGMHLPWPLADKVFQLPGWLHWTFTSLVGLLLGLNLGLVMRVLEVGNLHRRLTVVLPFWLIGAVLAEIAWRTVCARWYDVGLYFYLGQPMSRFWAALLAALLLTGVLIGADVTVVQQGLLANAASHLPLGMLSHRGTSGAQSVLPEATTLWLMSLIISLGFITFAAAQGVAEGRHAAVYNIIRQHQQMDLADRMAAFDEEPAVKAARNALARVLEHQRQRGELRGRVSETAKPFEDRLDYWEGQRLPGPAELTAQKEQMVHDARRDAIKAQEEFFELLHQAMETCHLPAAGRRNATSRRPW